MADSNAAKYTLIGTITAALIGAAATIVVAVLNAKEPTPPGPPTSSAAQVPVSYQGNWDGVVNHQYGDIRTHIHLGPGGEGQVVGSYELDDCDGEISYRGGTGPLKLLFTVVHDPSGSCSPTATVEVVLQSSQTLQVETFAGSAVSGRGTLDRS